MGFPVVPRAGCKQRVKGLLPLYIRHYTNMLTMRVAKTAQSRYQLLTLCDISSIEDSQYDNLLAMHFLGKKGQRRSLATYHPHTEFLRCRFHKFAILPQHLLCLV